MSKKKAMFMKTLGGVAPVPYTTNLVASYSFDTDFSDYTGNNPLTVTGNVLAGVTGGVVDNCADFEGTDDYTVAADSDDFSFTDGATDLPFSVSFWLNFDTISSGAGAWILSKRLASATNDEYQIFFYTNKFSLFLASQGSAGSNIYATFPYTAPTGGTTWEHFTVTYDGSETFEGITMYLNGVSQTLTNLGVGTYLGMTNTETIINIGSRSFGPTEGEFNGKMDEFHVWKNRELTSAEVIGIYNTENAGNSILPLQIPLQNIISEYKFEDNTLDTVGTNNGTATDLTYANGLVGKTGVFNSTTAKVVIPDSASFNFGSNAWSISMLIYITNRVENGMIVSKLNLTREFYVYYVDEKIQWYLESTNNTDRIYTQTIATPADNQWVHLICTVDDSLLVGGMKTYFNGVEQDVIEFINGTYVGLRDGNDPVVFGQHGNETGILPFSGNLDCVRFWNKELTQGEANLIATDELAGTDINP